MTTLPLPPFITLVLGILLATALLYGALSLMRRNLEAPMWEGFGTGWVAIIVILGLVWLGLFGLTVAAVFSGAWQAILDPTTATIGLGGLTAALLGAPFLIWGTILKHQTVRWQKEGHMTDRISKAVEQLGAEKKVDRIGRPVTVLTGKQRKLVYLVDDEKEWVLPPRSKITKRTIRESFLEERNDVFVGVHLDVATWEEERTFIEWRGEGISVGESEAVDAIGAWQVFSETVPNLEVRIGAILSLERIAQDSTTHDKGRDHVRVMEILCAYIRNNAPASDLTPRTPPFDIKWSGIDIQTAIDVLRRRTPDQVDLEKVQRFRLNLRGSDLSGADFTKGLFAGADMSLCRIECTDFSDCDLRGVTMIHSMLHCPLFFRADIAGLHLNYANVSKLEIGGFLSSERFSIFFEGAKIEPAIITTKCSENYLGSMDTSVHASYARIFRLGMEVSRARLEYAAQTAKLNGRIQALYKGHSAEDIEGAKMFEHWLPHHSQELVVSPLRNAFIDKHGLRGWPYDDT